MADYYSLLARAVANLPKSSPPSTRRAIYDRARKALTNQLRSLKPQLPESDIAREERALDEAVARLEAEFEPALAEVHTLPLAPPPIQPPPELSPAPPADFAAEADGELAEPEPPSPPAPPPPPPRPEPAIMRAPAPPVRPMAPGVSARPPTPKPAPPPPPPPAPAPAPSGGLPNAAAFKAPLLGGAEPADDVPEPVLSPVVRAYTEESPAPPLGAGAAERAEPARPVLSENSRRKTPTWLWVGGAVAVGFAASVAALALLMRPALQDLSVPAPIDTPAAAPAAPGKAQTRIGSPAPTPADTPSPAPTAEASAPAPSPTATSEPAPSPTPTVAASPSPTPSAAPPPAPAPTLPIASRAAMLVATVADAAKPQISVGNAVWSLVPPPAGQPASAIGVKSEVDIPDLKMHASMILRKNFDTSLPASHTIDLRVSFDPGSAVKGIKDIALPLMRRDDPPAADALTGVRVKISDNYFLVGLNRGESDIQRNVAEIAERGWFDFPMQLDDDRIAKLTFEKGADGEKIVAQALAAWK